MIGKFNYHYAKIMHNIFILIEDVCCMGLSDFHPSGEHFPPFYICSLLNG